MYGRYVDAQQPFGFGPGFRFSPGYLRPGLGRYGFFVPSYGRYGFYRPGVGTPFYGPGYGRRGYYY